MKRRMQQSDASEMHSPSLFNNLESRTSESSHDLMRQSRRDDWKNTTSVADLSDDMFKKDTISSLEDPKEGNEQDNIVVSR